MVIRTEETKDFKRFRRTVGGGTEYVIYNNYPKNSLSYGIPHYLFENGARCCPETRWADAPPTNPEQLYKVRKSFYRIRLEKAKLAFEDRLHQVETEARVCLNNGWDLPYTDDVLDELKELKATASRYQDDFNEFTNEEREKEEELRREQSQREGVAKNKANRMLQRLERL